ncbi:carbohydrate ABC transporter permease [Actinopolymorpha alba]|uniref:carbohydrate ABC transporter permease n=1 Tax=Actinopolymorpha alba TaxID=533267 RepID=UPI000684119A|nr:carbohydrate ABC transporter permease [Actinopolymorpha alba]
MFNTYAGMILPLLCDAVGMLLMKSAFEAVPYELEEAARIDGASVWRTFWSVVLPLVRPALITVTILSFQGSWNEFTHFLVATSDPDLATLNLGHRPAVRGRPQGSAAVPAGAGARDVVHSPDRGRVRLLLPLLPEVWLDVRPEVARLKRPDRGYRFGCRGDTQPRRS